MLEICGSMVASETLGPFEPEAELLCARAHLCKGYESQEAVSHTWLYTVWCSVVFACLLSDRRWRSYGRFDALCSARVILAEGVLGHIV